MKRKDYSNMEYILHILIITEIYIILTLSLNLIIGYTGLPAFGHSAFFCVGAYTSALLSINLLISPWIGLLAGGITSALLGMIVSLPTLRLKGDYLALATFGFGVIIYTVSKNWVAVTRGSLGISNIPSFAVFQYSVSTVWGYAILATGFTLTTYFILNRVVNSPFGRILKCIREDEIAALAIGKNVSKYKILTLAIGGFFAGIAGSLYAHYITFIDPSSFTNTESFSILLMVVFGGLGSLRGSIIGAVSLVLLPEALRFFGMPSSIAAPSRQMIYGFLLVILMLKRPQGILGQYKFK
jgi:branched-chain amino acid transport system permease protein